MARGSPACRPPFTARPSRTGRDLAERAARSVRPPAATAASGRPVRPARAAAADGRGAGGRGPATDCVGCTLPGPRCTREHWL